MATPKVSGVETRLRRPLNSTEPWGSPETLAREANHLALAMTINSFVTDFGVHIFQLRVSTERIFRAHETQGNPGQHQDDSDSPKHPSALFVFRVVEHLFLLLHRLNCLDPTHRDEIDYVLPREGRIPVKPLTSMFTLRSTGLHHLCSK